MLKKPLFTSKKGSVTVDAALCLPIFIISMGVLITLIISVGSEEGAYRAMTQSAIYAVDAAAAFDSQSYQLPADAAYYSSFAMYLKDEYPKGGGIRFSSLDLEGEYCNEAISLDHLASAKVYVDDGNKSTDYLGQLLKGEYNLIYRPFLGESEDFTLQDGDITVYVFPKAGERYHIDGCIVMIEGQASATLTEKLRKRCSACKICKPGSLPDGATVFLYSDFSGTYHRKSCATITKSYVAMKKSIAEEQGYTPCKLCLPGGL